MAGLRRRFLLVAVLLASQVLVSIMSGLVFASSPRENTIFPGVFIGGIDVGGLSREQAVKLLGDIVNKKLNNGQVILKYKDRQWSFKHFQIGIGLDIPASVDKAFDVGPKGTAFNALIARFETRYRNLNLPMELDVNEASLQIAMARVSSEISSRPEDAAVNYNAGIVALTPEGVGRELQVLPTISKIKESISQLQEAPVEIAVRVLPPKLTQNDLKGIKESLGIGLASFSRSGGETPDGIRLTVEGLNGQLVRPGEIFSFNELVGGNITEPGYRAPKITEGRLELESDTGASRVASALYQAVIYAGLEVRERHAHFSPPGYISPGQGAAVTDRQFDLKFLNNTETPVFIMASVRGNRIIVNLLGAKTPGRTVQVITQTLSGQNDSKVKYVKVERVYYNNGLESKKELLSQDRYQ